MKLQDFVVVVRPFPYSDETAEYIIPAADEKEAKELAERHGLVKEVRPR